MAKTMIDKMVDRFLGWKLPEDFGPDCHISFDRDTAEKDGWPIGTNLLTADQARQMLEHLLGQEVEAPERKDEFWGEDGIGSSMSGMAVI